MKTYVIQTYIGKWRDYHLDEDRVEAEMVWDWYKSDATYPCRFVQRTITEEILDSATLGR